jgi:hypothetical protein
LIDYDVTVIPMGVLGMQRLLQAVENAHPNDEAEWIEFKAGLDPSTKEGTATIAKAIVGFANRDIHRAQRWCGGHAFIVIGLEPGNVAGSREIDPADLHNRVNALLASPAPEWDPTPVTYKGNSVIVITVGPPKQGDPIACIGKSSGEVSDGNVYVRVPGKSERAKSADIRRLSGRLAIGNESLRDITVAAAGSIAAVDYAEEWLDQWIASEEASLLAPLALEPEPDPKDSPIDLPPIYSALGPLVSESVRSQAERFADILYTNREEDRTEDEYRVEVDTYLDRCRENLPAAFEDVRAAEATGVTFSVTNNTERNYAGVLIRLHVEGDVEGFDWVDDFEDWGPYVGRRPRLWGPWTESKIPSITSPNLNLGNLPTYSNAHVSGPPAPRPRIENGGSVTITCVPVHLRPGDTEELLTVNLVADRTVTADVRVTWTATATDVDGQTSGELKIPLAPQRMVLNLTRD